MFLPRSERSSPSLIRRSRMSIRHARSRRSSSNRSSRLIHDRSDATPGSGMSARDGGTGTGRFRSYPSGRSVAYTQDDAGRVTAVGSYASGIQYAPHGGLAQLQLGNSLWET